MPKDTRKRIKATYTEDRHAKVVKFQGWLQLQTGESVNLEEAAGRLIDKAFEVHESEKAKSVV